METKIKIVIINHAFQMEYYSRRWKLFAESYPNVDVTLLTFDKHEWYNSKSYTFGKSFSLKGKNIDDKNFHVRTFRVRRLKYRGYSSPDFKSILLSIFPDFIYVISGHHGYETVKVLKIRNKYLPKTKVAAFSMRGPALTLRVKHNKCNFVKWIGRRVLYCVLKRQQNYVYRNIDAMFCHYPDAVRCFKEEGLEKPIYMQTQVGVNEEWFHEDLVARLQIREKYNIDSDTYVFGSATRFTADKGVDIILEALPKEGNWKYLMMGSGSDEDIDRLRSIIKKRGLQDKVIITGFIDWIEMGKYWNAVDCAIHVPLTTPNWEETFSLAAIQPQITKKPIIGDTSGSVPYQVGFKEMIVPENDIRALNKKIIWVLNNKAAAAEIGLKMYERTKKSFEIQHLNNLFYDTITEDILQGKYDISKMDMANYNVIG